MNDIDDIDDRIKKLDQASAAEVYANAMVGKYVRLAGTDIFGSVTAVHVRNSVPFYTVRLQSGRVAQYPGQALVIVEKLP